MQQETGQLGPAQKEDLVGIAGQGIGTQLPSGKQNLRQPGVTSGPGHARRRGRVALSGCRTVRRAGNDTIAFENNHCARHLLT